MATSVQEFMFSQIFKPITAARHQVTMKDIACATDRVERRFSISIVDRAGVRLIRSNKDMEREIRVGVLGLEL